MNPVTARDRRRKEGRCQSAGMKAPEWKLGNEGSGMETRNGSPGMEIREWNLGNGGIEMESDSVIQICSASLRHAAGWRSRMRRRKTVYIGPLLSVALITVEFSLHKFHSLTPPLAYQSTTSLGLAQLRGALKMV